MSGDLSKSLKKLRESTEALNRITDSANQAVQKVEQFLLDANIGINAWVLLSERPDPDDNRYLEYRRVGQKFRIAIVEGTQEANETVKPWAECSRDEKLESVVKLPDLLIAIAKKVDERVAGAARAIGTVTQVLESLED